MAKSADAPVAVPDDGGATGAGVPAPARSGLSVLLVEDNVVNQTLARALLKRMGHTVTSVNNGQEAVDAVAVQAFDIVLMDCQMPVMDGFEATRRIRAGDAGQAQAGVPIVAMTANAMVGDRELCLECGMNDYVTKPIQVPLLKEAIARSAKPAAPASSSTPNVE